jgi:hypothetical protein
MGIFENLYEYFCNFRRQSLPKGTIKATAATTTGETLYSNDKESHGTRFLRYPRLLTLDSVRSRSLSYNSTQERRRKI